MKCFIDFWSRFLFLTTEPPRPRPSRNYSITTDNGKLERAAAPKWSIEGPPRCAAALPMCDAPANIGGGDEKRVRAEDAGHQAATSTTSTAGTLRHRCN